jgi:hypothetical protein
MKRLLARLLILGLLAGAAVSPAAAFFDQLYTFEGVVSSVGPNYLIIINQYNHPVLANLPPGQRLPSHIMVGVRVSVLLERSSYGQYILRELRRIDPLPGAPEPQAPNDSSP